MPEKNNSSVCSSLGLEGAGRNNNAACNHTTCIDADKIYDSARDKDCIEDLRVFLNDFGQDLIDHATNVRAVSSEVLWATIAVNSIPFNRGFFSVNIRYFFKICFEACIPGGKSQFFTGIAVFDKQSVLFGSEGNVSVFTSEACNNDFCPQIPETECRSNNPKVVLEVATPVTLGIKLVEKSRNFGCCCCTAEQIPEHVSRSCFQNNISDDFGNKSLFVTIGLFSLIRMERPVSLLLNAAEFCIPVRESAVASETDPCALFKNMSFPTCDFFPPSNELPVGVGRRNCETER